jgi:hypothetical protein
MVTKVEKTEKADNPSDITKSAPIPIIPIIKPKIADSSFFGKGGFVGSPRSGEERASFLKFYYKHKQTEVHDLLTKKQKLC